MPKLIMKRGDPRFSRKAVLPHLAFNPTPDQVAPANLKAALLMIPTTFSTIAEGP